MSELASRHCVPCKGGVPPLRGDALLELLNDLGADWEAVNEHHLEKEYHFRNFREALDFVNKVGEIAETEGHHPEIEFGWGHVKLAVWTHKIDGLTESDFILAAKADEALQDGT